MLFQYQAAQAPRLQHLIPALYLLSAVTQQRSHVWNGSSITNSTMDTFAKW